MGSFIVSARNAGKPKSYSVERKGKPVESGFPFLLFVNFPNDGGSKLDQLVCCVIDFLDCLYDMI